MSCTRGKANPDSNTKLRLFADSTGYCQNPNCNRNLFLTVGATDFHIAEMAHIISAGDNGPRTSQLIKKDIKGDFANLILLCPTCHTQIDKAEIEFPTKLVISWKSEHSQKINQLFSIKLYENRFYARQAILPLLTENRTIFEIYGPLTDERFNPESEMPKTWILKIHEHILPNNRKLLAIFDKNRSLLKEEEENTIELFRQHVLDFESKHINKEETFGIQFPKKLNQIFRYE